jgi:hypothetical protein
MDARARQPRQARAAAARPGRERAEGSKYMKNPQFPGSFGISSDPSRAAAIGSHLSLSAATSFLHEDGDFSDKSLM